MNDCHSEWSSVPAGVPLGTKLGPWFFIIMDNDLSVQGVSMWKFVDDNTVLEGKSTTKQVTFKQL